MIIPFCLVVGMFSACGGTETKTDGSVSDSSVFRIALLPVSECRPFLYADSCGWLDSLDIGVEFITYGSAMDADTALMNGTVQMGIVDEVKYDFMVSHCDSDTLYKVVEAPMNLSLVTTKSARIKNIKSLKEKIIAVTRNSALDYMADRIAEKANLTELEINRPQINDIRMRSQMLMQAQYDGAILPEPWATECVDSGAVRVISSKEVGKLHFCVVVRDTVMKVHKETVMKIKDIFMKAEKSCQHP